MPIPPVLLVLAVHALANPIICDIAPGLTLAPDGRQVVATFGTVCDRGEALDTSIVVQIREGEAWNTLDGSWKKSGTRSQDAGSGVVPYQLYEQRVACPAAGTFTFRLTEHPATDWGLRAEAEVRCTGVGPTSDG